MTKIPGSCLCGGVKFTISGEMQPPSHCHCAQCQKQHGAAFRTRARVNVANFEWVRGEDLVTFYESSPDMLRGFCRVCGSPVLNKFGPASKAVSIRPEAIHKYGISLATLDADPGVRAVRHDYARSKAPWLEITDDLPQFETFPNP